MIEELQAACDTVLANAKGQKNKGALVAGWKWPNDVMLNQRKVGGILSKLVDSPGGNKNLVGLAIGVGVNLNQPGAEMAAIERLVWPATSVRRELEMLGVGSSASDESAKEVAAPPALDVRAFREAVSENFLNKMRLFCASGGAPFRPAVD